MTDAFISYSRKDKQFVQKLHEALSQEKRDIWVDWEDIPPTAEWRQEIGAGIEAADNVIFVISPDFVASSECDKELEHAIKNNKRLVPIVWREVEANSVRLEVSKLNWIFFRESDDFESSLQLLREALDLDLEYVKEHTRLLNRASEWKKRERNPSWLLRGRDLKEAEQWLAQADREPKPTQLHNRYLIASVENRRKFWVRITSIIGVLAVAATVSALVAVIEERIAKKAEIEASTDFSEASLLKDEQLEALIASMIAAKKLQELKIVTDTEPLSLKVVAALRNAVYNVEEFNRLQEKENKTEVYSVRDVSFSPNNQLIASVSFDKTVIFWSNNNQPQLDTPGKIFKDEAALRKVDFTPDGNNLVTVSKNNLRLWNIEDVLTSQQDNPPAPKNFQGYTSIVNSFRISPDGQMLASASASNDQTIILWKRNQENGKFDKFQTLKGHQDWVWDVTFSPPDKIKDYKMIIASAGRA